MEASVFKMTHEQSLQQNGYTVCSPISGSMKPLIRPNVDSAVFVPPEKIRKYDVALYRREGQAIMHRVVGFRGEDTLIRGDNSSYTETVPRREIFGVMQGFYRGQRYVAADEPRLSAVFPVLGRHGPAAAADKEDLPFFAEVAQPPFGVSCSAL